MFLESVFCFHNNTSRWKYPDFYGTGAGWQHGQQPEWDITLTEMQTRCFSIALSLRFVTLQPYSCISAVTFPNVSNSLLKKNHIQWLRRTKILSIFLPGKIKICKQRFAIFQDKIFQQETVKLSLCYAPSHLRLYEKWFTCLRY